MQQERLSHGFGPYIDADSRTLILGSFPSVKSREAAFFYGHPQNRFWKVLERVFEDNMITAQQVISRDEFIRRRESDLAVRPSATAKWDEVPRERSLREQGGSCEATKPCGNQFETANNAAAIAAKKAFLKRHHIALYDVIESCTITGSSDSSIRDVVPADIMGLLKAAPIERIFVNGKTAKKYYDKYLYSLCGQIAVCLPSTSPANAAWSLERLIEAWKVVARPEIRYVEPTSNFYADKDISDGYLVWPGAATAGKDTGSVRNSRIFRNLTKEGAFSLSDTASPESIGSAANSLPLIRFHSLDKIDFVDAAFTTRCGGSSRGFLGSLNLGFKRGDTGENLQTNWERCAAAMDCSLEQMIATDQVHGTEILRAESVMGLGTGLAPREAGQQEISAGEVWQQEISAGEAGAEPAQALRPRVTGVDGFWCDTPGLTLCAAFADCVPVYLVDPVGRRISLVHSGWKGTVSQIAGKAVKILEAQGSRPADIVAVIGPSISGAHYEVTEGVIAAFRGEKTAFVENSCLHEQNASEKIKKVDACQLKNTTASGTEAFPPYSAEELSDIYVRTDAKHYHLDLWAAIYYTLVHAGVRSENIHFSGICTWENADILWSHRRSGGRRGNMNAFLKIR